MNSFDPVFQSNALFYRLSKQEITDLLVCLDVKIQHIAADTILLHEEDPIESFGIVLSGHLQVIIVNIDGSQLIVTSLTTGDYFAETFCFSEIAYSPVSVIASSESDIAIFSQKAFLHSCDKNCQSHQIMIQNMLRILAQKNLFLQNRMMILSQKNIRKKIIFWLRLLPQEADGSIQILFNRNEMADFLCIDRSALSRELAHMRQDNLIEYHKNIFRLNC